VLNRKYHDKGTFSFNQGQLRKNASASAGPAPTDPTDTLSLILMLRHAKLLGCFSSRSLLKMGSRLACTFTQVLPMSMLEVHSVSVSWCVSRFNEYNLLRPYQHSGGDPYSSMQSARVILADPNTEIFGHLIKTYQGISDQYIESYLWVKKCIEKSSVVYTPLVYKNPGGRRPGEECVHAFSFQAKLTDTQRCRRTQFTEEDEEHLCSWIAAKIPYKETGGRTGNRLYQQLCDLVCPVVYCIF